MRALECKINHDQVSAEQKLGLTKVRPDLFLMLINPIAPKLTVPNGTVIPLVLTHAMNHRDKLSNQRGTCIKGLFCSPPPLEQKIESCF